MEKRCNINIEFLLNLKKLILQYNIPSKYVDFKTIDRLISILSGSKEITDFCSLEESVEDNIEELELYRKYYSFIRQIIKKTKDTFVDDIRYRELGLSDSDVISLNHDFFKSLNGNYSDDFNDLRDDIYDHIEFIKPNSYCEGETFFISSSGDYFCVVPNYRNICKPTILTHEVTHVMDWFNNTSFHENFLISEVHSLVMEMISADYYGKKLGYSEEGEKRRLELHNLIKSDSYNIYDYMQITHLYMKLGRDEWLRAINDKYTSEYLNFLRKYTMSDFFKYQIAYLIAIELYTYYKSDKEKALWIIRQIILNGNDDNIIELLETNSIYIGENLSDYERKLALKKD